MARIWFGHGLPLPLHYNAPYAASPVVARADAPETLIPPDGFGARPRGLLPFVPLKAAEVRDQLPKALSGRGRAEQTTDA